MAAVADGLRAAGPAGTGVLFSSRMSNEDLWLARRLFVDTLGVAHADFRVPPRTPGSQDDLLRVADKTPNSRGAELLGCGRAGAADGRHVLDAARAGRLRLLWVFGHDLLDSGWPQAEVEEALARVEGVVFQGPNANGTSARAHVVLPSAAWVEREGTWTNVDGPGPAVLARRAAARGGAAGLGDPGGGGARRRPGLAAAARGERLPRPGGRDACLRGAELPMLADHGANVAAGAP